MKSLLVDQIKAAPYTTKVIHNLVKLDLLNPKNPNQRAIIETDIYRLRRGLCLPAAAATCMNIILGKRSIGDSRGNIKVGDFFRLLLPFHGLYQSTRLPHGWLIATDEGDVYHHAIIAFAKTFGINAISVINFKSLDEFKEIIQAGGSVAISLDNQFVTEQTLKEFNCVTKEGEDIYIKVETESKSFQKRRFEHGRHVITILRFSANSITFADSFNLPQTKTHGLTVSLPIADADKYLTYATGGVTRAIIFFLPNNSSLQQLLGRFKIAPIFIPPKVTQTLILQVHHLVH